MRNKNSAGWAAACLLLVLSGAPLGASADAQADYAAGEKAYQSDDLIGAMLSLERAAAAGHTKAQVLLAYIFDKAEENAAALKWYREAADAGEAEAAYQLGNMYSAGDGVTRDHAQALAWYQQAVDGGHTAAVETLGIAHLEGRLGMPPDPERGRELLARAADSGSESARRLLDGSAQEGKQ